MKNENKLRKPEKTQIKVWDWHYRVGFDNKLAQAIREEFAKICNNNDRDKEIQELTQYQSIISLDCLISHVLKSPSRAEAFLETSKSKQLLFLPEHLASGLNIALTRCNKLNDTIKKGLEELIHTAVKQEFFNIASTLVESALGKDFLQQASEHLEQTQVDFDSYHYGATDLHPTETNRLLEYFQEAIINYGKSLFPPELKINPVFQTQASQDLACFAEYWPDLITGETNTLLLSNGLQSESQQDIIGTFVHEIGGHACFYELASKDNCRLIDHGAMCLIEGWATWTEWHSPFANSLYKNKLRSNALFSIKISSETDASKAEGKLRAIYSSKPNQSAMLHQSLTNFYQYPGLSLSYHAGAAWYEMKLKNESPIGFWRKNHLNHLTNILSNLD